MRDERHPRTPPGSILVVVTRRIGDVLLATPLIRSLKRAWPDAAVDALVFEGTQDAIAHSTDVRRVLAIAPRPGLLEHAALVLRILRRYEVALSLVPGDRPTLYAWLAGRWRAGLLLPTEKERWKRRFLDRWVAFDDRDTHTVRMHLALADVLGIEPHSEIAVTWSEDEARQVTALLGTNGARPIAVLHPSPKFNYKMWRAEGWIETARWLAQRGYRIVISGGPDPAELAQVAALERSMPQGTLNLAGRLTLGGTASLLSRAAIYVGPDTAVTHMAAALGVPTVAFYGPTDPVKWGPWPQGHTAGNPWRRLGSQSSGRVRLIQGDAPCAPCNKEGCDRHVASYSDCLQALPATRVIAAIRSVTGDA